jgi:penicillin-binding protein 1C
MSLKHHLRSLLHVTKRLLSRRWIQVVLATILLILCLPVPKDDQPYSRALYSKDQHLLAATLSSEQQWRLPLDDTLPTSLTKAIIIYEDEYFNYHLGFNPIAIAKAIYQNLSQGSVRRGASTIPMQVMRLRSRGTSRTWLQKIYETLSAIKYSLTTKKSQVLKDWASLAPFGGNTIGVKAAALRYFGRDVHQLSWSEYAMLAVMPNGPSTANLTKNRNVLKYKRDFLLRKLCNRGLIPKEDLELYQGEDLPELLSQIPQDAYHFLSFLASEHADQYVFRSTIDYSLQLKIQELIYAESQYYKLDGIQNMAAVIIDLQDNSVISYIGNTPAPNGKFNYVDIVQAPRSYGSLLKPLLYMYGVDNGVFLPGETVEDIPTAIGEYQPLNFDEKFRGAVAAEDIITLSLNVPSVRLLQEAGLDGFYNTLERFKIKHVRRGASHYGLSLILGGAEASLWDMTRLYKGIAMNYDGQSYPYDHARYLSSHKPNKERITHTFSSHAVKNVVQAMSNISRPREEKSWELYVTDQKVAWKTGTSFGYKDAWAIGFNGRYACGIWVGNQDSEPRSGLTGIQRAAPVLFKIFNSLPHNRWFSTQPPITRRDIITACRQSGKLAGPLCKYVHKVQSPPQSMKLKQCTYHQIVALNTKGLVIHDQCHQTIVKRDTLYVLPPTMEYYYRQGNIDYKGLGTYDEDCPPVASEIRILYPDDGIKIFLPRVLSQLENKLIAKAYLPKNNSPMYWYIDGHYHTTTMGTSYEHSISLAALGEGHHSILVQDASGASHSTTFDILPKK